jgi:molybdate transport system substrate-binding protein
MKKAALWVLIPFLVGCGGVAGSPPSTPKDLNVFAAASLTAAFTDLGNSFEKSHPRVRVRPVFAGSSTLVQQIQQGAPADVFASADTANMQKLSDAGLTETPSVFARNKLEIVVQKGNPKRIAGLADLARPDLIVVLAAPGVPAGTYAAQALAKAAIKVTPKSQEQDVKSVISKVSLGEADAGIVYVTDVSAAGSSVEGVEIPDAENVIAIYPMAVLKQAPDAADGRAFDRFVLSADGQRVLARYGFLQP